MGSSSEIGVDYREFAPPAILAPIVDAFWSLSPRQISSQIPLLKYRVLPDGCVDLFCRFQRSSAKNGIINPILMIYGPTDRFELVDVDSSIEFIGVRFKPGEAFSLLHSSPLSLSGETIVAQDYSADFAPLFDRLSTCHSTQQALNLLQRFVLEGFMLSPPPENGLRVREAIRLLSTNEGQTLRIADVAGKLGVSERTLRRDITQSVGLSPKCLSRILRFQRTVASLRSSPFDLCTTALDRGYADQAHLGREFRELAGLSPTAYMRSLSQ
jgi:AraC-like DNA-binding protein